MSNSSPSSHGRRLVFPARQRVELESFHAGSPAAGQVLVRTTFSLMSTGTENIVFNRLFDAGSHWDHWVKYPFYPGYASVGVVEGLGAGVDSLKEGDRVAFRVGHASHAVVEAANCFPIPEPLPDDHAVWFSLAKIAFMAAKAADYRLGDRSLIIGAGPIGQMSIRWAYCGGVESILAVDMAANRMALAEAGGATAVISLPIGEAREVILAAGGGRLPGVVVDSTGNSAVFSAALGLAADRGKVVILGDTGSPGAQTLTSDVIMRGLTIMGAHDIHNTPEWNDGTIARLFFSLAAQKRFHLAGLNTHVFEPGRCGEAYATANENRAATMGIVFDWTRS